MAYTPETQSGASQQWYPFLEVTSNHTVAIDDLFIVTDATAGDVTVALPKAAERKGRKVNVKRSDGSANTVTVAAATGDSIEDEPIQLVLQGEAFGFVSDGASKWWLF